jgi:cation diffusion facilitator family transporter
VDHNPKRSVLAALAANSAITVAKLIAGLVSGSAAMLAEAVHSVADTGNQLLLLLGIQRSQIPPDAEHPLGHGRERYLWTFLVAVNLFTLGAAFSVYNGIHGLVAGHELPEPLLAYFVLAFSAVFEGLALRTAWQQFKARRPPGKGLWRSLRDSKDPEILTVIGEDSAAISGLAVAAIGIALAQITGEPAFDAAASIGIGLILAAVAFLLGREMHGLIVGESAGREVDDKIRRVVEASGDVDQVVGLVTIQPAPDEIFVVLEVVFENELATDDIERTIDQLEARIREHVPEARRIFIEPEAERDRDGAQRSSR